MSQRAPKRSGYWVHCDDGFVEVEGQPVTLAGFEWLDLFMRRDSDGMFVISEGQSGALIGQGPTRSDALDILGHVARLSPKAIEEKIERTIHIYGLSPRYKSESRQTWREPRVTV